MIVLALLAAIPGYVADGEPPTFPTSCGNVYTRDECVKYYRDRNLICASRETQNISDYDPALVIFQGPSESLKNAKVDLAIERTNGCDFPEEKHHAH
jgi:hypothetical protein